MITLHTFGRNLGVSDPSPFVLKVETYLRMAGIEFQIKAGIANMRSAPKGKLPFIEHDGKVIADSQFIIEYLKQTFGDTLDQNLIAREQALAYLLTKSLDENLYFILVYSRWIDPASWPTIKQAFFKKMPWLVRLIVPGIVRKKVINTVKRQGLSRHSHEEILHIAQQSFQALSDLLGEKPYIFGEHPSSFDATAYAFLAEFILIELDNEFNQLARSMPNLVAYCERIQKTYYQK